MAEKQPVFLLTYDHGGYILWGPNFNERIESAIEWLTKYPGFKIGLDNEAFAYDKYAESNPEIIDSIRDMLVKFKGRFAIGSSTYGQPLSVFVNEESNVRQLVYAIRTNLKYFGATPPVFAISEHALHSQIPQLIKQAGYKEAIMRTHFMMYGYNPTYDEPFGWWVGDDGTKIPTVPTYEGEGAHFGVTTFDNWVLTRWPDQTSQSLEEFAEKFKDIQPLLGSRYDDSVLRCEGLVEHTERNSHYKWVLLEDLLDIYGSPEAEFAPSANEFVVRMPWGYCGNKIFNDCRRAEISAGTAERANAAAVLAGGRDCQAELEESWKKLLISQHHDIQICGLLGDEEKYIPVSLDQSKKVLDESMEFISCLFKTQSEHNLIVFNPLSWKSKQMVSTEIALERGKGVDGFKVLLGNESIPYDIKVLDKRSNSKITRAVISFEAETAPLSANCYSIVPAGTICTGNKSVSFDAVNGILTTSDYEIKLNEYGIASIKNKNTNAAYVSSTGSLFRGIIDGEDCTSKGEWVVHCYKDYASAVQVGRIGSISYEFEMVASSVTHRMDCRVTFNHNGEKIGTVREFEVFKENTNGFVHEDKLRFILGPCASKDAVGIRDLPFLIAATPDKYVQGNYWTAISDGNTGIAYFNRGAMGSVREEGGFSMPLEYANEYVWGSRYLYGKYTHEFSICPFEGSWENAGLHKKALEYQYPFATYELKSSNDGKYSNSINFMNITPSDNVMLSALYPEDGSVIARFYEYQGQAGTVDINSDFGNIQDEVNIMGHHTAAVVDNKLEFRKHEIKSIRFTRK